ncbi:hypothetical protein [Pantoea piersonii]|uniref:hypothetical protein n=1 Tax=Pantoea piersonii TaxID=2364647 RepID=UPI0028AC2A20|nr:hypothetical protein [Pantoea piersonii]
MKTEATNKELVAAGHQLAKALGSASPLLDMAKLVSDLATRLDCAIVRGDVLATENATIKTMNDVLSEELRGYESDGAYDGPVANKLWHSNSETPATDAYLNSVRTEGVIMFASKQLSAASDLDSTIALERLMLDAEELAGQLRAGKGGE